MTMIRRSAFPSGKASRAAVIAGALLLIIVVAFLLFTDPLVNWLVRPRIISAFNEAYPAYALHIGGMRYSIADNRVDFASVAIDAVDSAYGGTVDALSLSGLHWTRLLWGGHLGPDDFADVTLDIDQIETTLPGAQYECRCERLHASVRDSVIVADSLLLRPLTGDEEFFRGSRFRETRFRLVAPHVSVKGLACIGMCEAKYYHARSLECRDVLLDVLINKDKASKVDSSPPAMPAELLTSLQTPVQVERLVVVNGRLNYGERFAVEGKVACITLDSLELQVTGIDNQAGPGAPVAVRAKAKFMKAGTMLVEMSIPLGLPTFSLEYSGALSAMNLSALNTFLETAEQIRIKTGVLHSATFAIHVEAGRASGTVRAVYRDLSLAAINKRTGSESGFADNITSFIANTFKLHQTNVPDKSGKLKIGQVKYMRARDDPFFRFEWFALRSGVKDVAGF